jgi:hypothetical protein
MIGPVFPPALMTNLERELDVLFQAPFAEFVGTRNGLATRLKKEGRDAEGARVRGLAKPTYTAWLVNQLYWGARVDFDVFLKAADRVRAGEKSMLEGRRPGAAHASAGGDRKGALDTLVARATARAAEEGTPLSPALTERLRVTLDAIGAHGAGAARHARGRLQEDLDPPGFAAFAALADGTVPAKRSTPAPVIPMPVRSAPNPRLTDARARVQAARGETARHQDALAASTEAERRAKAALDQAKARLADVDRAQKSAQAEVESAQAALKARQGELREATREATSSEKALERATEALKKME